MYVWLDLAPDAFALPSSKSHSYVTASPSGSVPSAVNVTLSGAVPVTGSDRASTIGARLPAGLVTVIVIVFVAVAPLASLTVTLAVKVPGVHVLVRRVLGERRPPSPKSHVYSRSLSGPSGSLPVAVNCTVSGAGPLVRRRVASTVGGWTPGAVTVTVTSLEVLSPSSSVAVTFAVYVPGLVYVRVDGAAEEAPSANSHL